MSWSTSELRVRLAPLNQFKPSSKIFNWPFQGGTSLWLFYDFVLSSVCYVFVRVCLYMLCGHLLGKGWPLGSRLWCLTGSWLLSHWYPGSGVVLNCIDSWCLHPYLLYVLCRRSEVYMIPWTFQKMNSLLISNARECIRQFVCINELYPSGKSRLVKTYTISIWK